MFKRTEFLGMYLNEAFSNRAASQVTQSIFDFEDEKDTDAYNEEIISHCADPMPSSFFLSEDFLDAFENQCEEVSTSYFLYIKPSRAHIFLRTSYS